MTTSYQKLKERMKLVSDLRKVARILTWDSDVMMPPLAATERGEANAALAAIMHEKSGDPAIKEWLDQAENEVETEWDKRNLALTKEEYLLSAGMPEKLVQQGSAARMKTNQLWQAAKATSDWQSVEPALTELFSVIQEETEFYSQVLGLSRYDAQLYLYASGNKQSVIDPLFAMLQKELPPLVQQIIEKQKTELVPKPFSMPAETQEKVVRQIIQKLGYDFNRGRLDTSIHPASYGNRDDSRITTRYNENDPLIAIIGGVHETGHALYKRNLPIEWDGQMVGTDFDITVHESQSLIMERHVALSDEFIEYMFDVISAQNIDAISPENVKAILRQVKPSFIRFGADEVTYPLHIILRYEIEKLLFNNDIKVSDIPHIWNQKMKEYLGLDVTEHRLGCMQDIHWFSGMFGYFPTYTQGALYAAQIFDTANKSIPELSKKIRSADISDFNGFLTDKIHRWGQFYSAPELIEKATGSKPDAKYFLEHLRNRYL